MSKKTKNIGLLALLVAGLAAMAFIWNSYAQKPEAKAVSMGAEKNQGRITLSGSVVAGKSADLGFVLPERIAAITKQVGDKVKAGEILAIEENGDVKAQLGAANATLSSSQAALKQLKDNLKKEKLKLKDLSGNDRKIQKAQIDSVENGINAQESTVLAVKENVKNVQAQLDKTILRAPFDGTVTRQDGQVGETAGQGTAPFMTVETDSKSLKIEAWATDLDVSKIKAGDQANVVLDAFGSDKSFAATVSSVDPAAKTDGSKDTYKVTLEFGALQEGLKSGMHAQVSFE